MYILITPAKNEQSFLPEVACSVINQTIRPILWVIVDDGSEDETPNIIDVLKRDNNWIKSIRLPIEERSLRYHYPYVCKKGFDYAFSFCEMNEIRYDYIALLDADSVLEERYFEKLINYFENDKNLGIVSGGVYYNINGKLEWLKSNENLPSGTGRLWSKKCFFDTGYLVRPAADSISNVKAILHGWDIKKFKDVVLIQKRFTSSADGIWNGFITDGYKAYYLNKHPLLVLLNAVYFSFKKPHYKGVPYLYGYIRSFLRANEQIDDDEIRSYYWSTRLKEYLRLLLKFT